MKFNPVLEDLHAINGLGVIMRKSVLALVGLCVLISGCTGSSFDSERTVFNNPYVKPELENGPVGPACDEGVLRDDNRCWIDGKAYPVSDRYGRDANGNLVYFTRDERRLYRDRAEAIESRQDVLESLENGTPIPPDSPALPENQRMPPPPVKPSSD
ncbi:hypothetical protein [Erythrobacter crassostreae]|uniref:Lipoprotein n=1 Tax=Erythrobacter crassostreae TaxID=2828328 RepID=A0A9X1F3I8_9SPHN|nr:hypothetical protein [Erythrobacter crassostrea]MBV7259636.1 hypothetical protein [Erythrobacter crassostrea]